VTNVGVLCSRAPFQALAEITTQFNDLIQADITKDNYCLITPIYSKNGEKKHMVFLLMLGNSFYSTQQQ
jgi:hypothetical protein